MLLHAATSATRDVWHYKGYNLLKKKRKGRLVLIPANKQLDYSVGGDVKHLVSSACAVQIIPSMSLSVECKLFPPFNTIPTCGTSERRKFHVQNRLPLLDKGEQL